MKAIYNLLILVIFFTSISCGKDEICIRGKGSVDRREIFLSEFKEIELHGNGMLFISEGPVQRVEIETHENLFERINYNVVGGKWEAKFKGCVNRIKTFNVFVTLPKLESVRVSGSGDVIGGNVFHTESMRIKVSGSGDVSLHVEAQHTTTEVSGSGKVYLAGNTDRCTIDVSGSGDVEAFDMQTRIADVKISGSGKSKISVSEKLDVKVSGSGDVYYKGTPVVNSKISGSGKVQKN